MVTNLFMFKIFIVYRISVEVTRHCVKMEERVIQSMRTMITVVCSADYTGRHCEGKQLISIFSNFPF